MGERDGEGMKWAPRSNKKGPLPSRLGRALNADAGSVDLQPLEMMWSSGKPPAMPQRLGSRAHVRNSSWLVALHTIPSWKRGREEEERD